jgi:YbbR domain-containing protein
LVAVEKLRRRDNLAYKLVSIALAFALWLYVSEERNPTGESVLEVPLEVREVPDELVVAEKPAEVVVRVQGAKQVVSRLTAREVQAFVSLGGAQPGKNVRTVQVALPSRVELVEVSPARVSVVVEEVSQRQLPVEVWVRGEPAPGYEALAPMVRPEEVVAYGPRNWLNRLSRGFVEVNVAARTGDFHGYMPVRLLERDGRETQPASSLNPASVEVFVPIVPVGSSKEVPVRVALEGEPAAGYKVGRVTVHPGMIRVYGSEEALARTAFVVSRPVDLTGARKTVRTSVDIVLPEGLRWDPVAVEAVVEIIPSKD